MKKNNPNILNAIVESLGKGNGRVKTCKQVGISYETFTDWLDPKSPRFNSDLSERIQKAEGTGKIRIKEICENVIMKAATDNDKPIWQAAAWMLERKFPQEYGVKQNIDHTTKGESLNKKIDLSKLSDEELETMAELQKKIEQ